MAESLPRSFTPALRFSFLTPAYDAIVGATMGDASLKRALLRLAEIQPRMDVLEFGCGTASLSIAGKLAHPEAAFVGLDPDARILDIARRKAERRGAAITLHRGHAGAHPFSPASFDRAFSSLVLHHLRLEAKREALFFLRNVLREGGALLVLDWDRPSNLAMRAAFTSVRLLDGFETTRDHVEGRLPCLLEEAGFRNVRPIERRDTIYGTLGFYRAER